jgi:hypothetical protein
MLGRTKHPTHNYQQKQKPTKLHSVTPPVRQHTTSQTSYSLSFSEFPPSDPDPKTKRGKNTYPDSSSFPSMSYFHTVRALTNQFWT